MFYLFSLVRMQLHRVNHYFMLTCQRLCYVRNSYIPFTASHNIALLSTEPDISFALSGDHAKSYTSSMWPLKQKSLGVVDKRLCFVKLILDNKTRHAYKIRKPCYFTLKHICHMDITSKRNFFREVYSREISI